MFEQKTPPSTRKEIAEIAEKIVAKRKKAGGYERLYCVACGGSFASFYPLVYMIRNESAKLSSCGISSNEFVHATPKGVDEKAIVLVNTFGATPESLEAARVAKERGAAVVACTGERDGPLVKIADHAIIYTLDLFDISKVSGNGFCTSLLFGFELLRLCEDYPHYQKVHETLDRMPTICAQALEKVQKRAVQFGEDHKDDDFVYVMTSGASMGSAYSMAICLFMEMEWVNAATLHSGEFFHGPFEVTDNQRPFLLLMNSGKTRPLDERALAFLQKYGKRITVLDAVELGAAMIDDSVVDYFEPVLLSTISTELGKKFADAKQHPLMMRRYMGKVEY